MDMSMTKFAAVLIAIFLAPTAVSAQCNGFDLNCNRRDADRAASDRFHPRSTTDNFVPGACGPFDLSCNRRNNVDRGGSNRLDQGRSANTAPSAPCGQFDLNCNRRDTDRGGYNSFNTGRETNEPRANDYRSPPSIGVNPPANDYGRTSYRPW